MALRKQTIVYVLHAGSLFVYLNILNLLSFISYCLVRDQLFNSHPVLKFRARIGFENLHIAPASAFLHVKGLQGIIFFAR